MLAVLVRGNSMANTDPKQMKKTYGIHLNPIYDIFLRMLIGTGIAFGVCWYFSCPNWILISLIVVMGVCLGFGLPRWQGWDERQKRARKAKHDEEEKWGFHSLEREGPWINYIDYPLVKETKYASGGENDSYTFYSEWLVIQEGYIMVNPGKPTVDLDEKTVTYDFTRQRAYAWDGCTPKMWFFWLAVIGTPDWFQKIEEIKTVIEKPTDDKSKEKETKVRSNDDYVLKPKEVFWKKALHASLIHDVLYQYLDNIPISRRDADWLFYYMLKESGVFCVIRWLYLFGVRCFGGIGVKKNQHKQKSDFTVIDFPKLKLE